MCFNFAIKCFSKKSNKMLFLQIEKILTVMAKVYKSSNLNKVDFNKNVKCEKRLTVLVHWAT